MFTQGTWLQASVRLGRSLELPHSASCVLYVSLVSLVQRRQTGDGQADSVCSSELEKSEVPQGADNEHALSFCPVCSARLEAHKCKLRCPTCGYYMSCSDYY